MPRKAEYPWFPTARTIKDDPRVLELDHPQFRLYIYLRVMASEADQRGTIPPFRPAGFAASLRTSPEDLSAALELMAELGLLVCHPDGSVEIPDMLELLYDKESDRPEATRERQQRSRSGRREPSTASHADVTRMSRDVTRERKGENKLNENKTERGAGLEDQPAPAPAGADPPPPDKDNSSEVAELLTQFPAPQSVTPQLWAWWIGMVAAKARHAGRDPAVMLADIDIGEEIAAYHEQDPAKRGTLQGWLRNKPRFWLDDNPTDPAAKNGANGHERLPAQRSASERDADNRRAIRLARAARRNRAAADDDIRQQQPADPGGGPVARQAKGLRANPGSGADDGATEVISARYRSA